MRFQFLRNKYHLLHLFHWHYSPMQIFASIMDLLLILLPKSYFWFPKRRFFYAVGLLPHAQPSTWRTKSNIYNPWDWVAQLYSQALGVTFYDMHRLQWNYSLIPVTTQDRDKYPKIK